MAENTVQNTNQEITTAHEETHEPDRYVAPAVDIHETENGLRLVADMPGLEQEDIHVAVEKDVLTIKGVARPRPEREFLVREFEPTGYYRQFTLGSKIDQNAIKASYRHGVLELTLPIAAEAKPRQIEVRVA